MTQSLSATLECRTHLIVRLVNGLNSSLPKVVVLPSRLHMLLIHSLISKKPRNAQPYGIPSTLLKGKILWMSLTFSPLLSFIGEPVSLYLFCGGEECLGSVAFPFAGDVDFTMVIEDSLNHMI